MYNNTISKFGYPQSLLFECDHWVVLFRQNQVTVGSMILAYKGEQKSIGNISKQSFLTLPSIFQLIEKVVKITLGASNINYLALMMVDPHVHFHVIPRYKNPFRFEGVDYPDIFWPSAPDLSQYMSLTKIDYDKLLLIMKTAFLKQSEGLAL
jgi:diadenosine tetraphosphate (Ap4A) HIT family hydrolase